MDLAHGGQPVRISDGERGRPVFLNDQQLFYAPAFVTTMCGEAPQGGAIYNLKAGTEVPTSIDRVEVTWPAMKT